MDIQSIISLAYDDQVTGHLLVRPALWYHRQVEKLCQFQTPSTLYSHLLETQLISPEEKPFLNQLF